MAPATFSCWVSGICWPLPPVLTGNSVPASHVHLLPESKFSVQLQHRENVLCSAEKTAKQSCLRAMSVAAGLVNRRTSQVLFVTPPTPVFLPGESHGQRSLAGYTWQSDMIEATEHTHTVHWPNPGATCPQKTDIFPCRSRSGDHLSDKLYTVLTMTSSCIQYPRFFS